MKPLMTFALALLLNSVWQVALIWVVAHPLARMARRRADVQVEHRIWVAALLLQASVPAAAVLLKPTLLALVERLRPGSPLEGRITDSTSVVGALNGQHQLQGLFAILALLYVVSFVIASVRVLWQLAALRRLHMGSCPLNDCSEVQAVTERIRQQLGIRRVQCATRTGLRAPVTYGLLQPVVVLPDSVARDGDISTLLSLLAHELAHIQRHDFAKNLFYRLVSLPVEYHPLHWLTRQRVLETREMVCDAAAADLTGSRTRYANTLLHLAQSMLPVQSTPTHAIGIFESGSFERRILMLQQTPTTLGAAARLVLLGSAAFAMLGIGSAAFAFSATPAPVSASVASSTEEGKRVQLSPEIAAGQILTKVPPVYPKIAKAAKVQGSVVLAAVIGEDGTMQSLHVLSGPDELRGSALDAVRQWVYKPYLLNGEPTAVETQITVTYSLGQ